MTDSGQKEKMMTHLEELFGFDLEQARTFISFFQDEMKRGLAGNQSSLKMIPSYIGRPIGSEQGEYMALDLGGTNLRVLTVRLDGRGGASVTAARRFTVPQSLMHATGHELFDFLARCVSSFLDDHSSKNTRSRHLAFTFSFPVVQNAVNSGILLRWTKGFAVSGVEGKDVVAMLADALSRQCLKNFRVAALANDTVGTLMAKCYADPDCDMGVILGTGTNACYPEKAGRIANMSNVPENREIIVNLEWGDFNRIEQNIFDQALDRQSLNPGAQRLEKMVSGMYLGELLRLVLLNLIEKGVWLNPEQRCHFQRIHSLSSEHLSRAEAGEDILSSMGIPGTTKEDAALLARVSHIIAARAARIAAAAIAAVVTWMDENIEKRHSIAIDGSLFEKYPQFRTNMESMLVELYGGRSAHFDLCLTPDGSAVGAAVIAAVAAKTYTRDEEWVGDS